MIIAQNKQYDAHGKPMSQFSPVKFSIGDIVLIKPERGVAGRAQEKWIAIGRIAEIYPHHDCCAAYRVEVAQGKFETYWESQLTFVQESKKMTLLSGKRAIRLRA